MQTLGLAESTPRSESRLKALFWPSIQNATDVDYLGTQGFWICALVATLTLAFLTITGHAITGVFTFLFYFLSGVGVREHSRYASALAFFLYATDTVLEPHIVRIVFTAILLSNVRATWIASRWKPDSEEAVPSPRLNETWSDKLSDILPAWLWPKVRIAYYIYSLCMLAIVGVGVIAVLVRRTG